MTRTALVVDDDHLEREYLTELLVRSGFAVRAAASVPNAAAIARQMRFDYLFIDDRMPGGSGAQILREILRAGAPAGAAQATFLVGDASEEGAAHYREDGFSYFLEKPVAFDRLWAALSGNAGAPETAQDGALKDMDSRPGAGKEAQGGAPRAAGEEAPTHDKTASGLDTAAGIEHCGSEENYRSALQIFCDALPMKAAEIEGYFDAADWENYTIKVHALKSSARIIGAAALSEQAAALEDAGNRRDIDRIQRGTPALLADYRALLKEIAPLIGRAVPEEADGARAGGQSAVSAAPPAQEGIPADADDRPAADAETLRDAYRSITEFAGQMDYDLVEMVLHSMEELRLAPADEERFARIRGMLLSLDWERMAEEADAGIRAMGDAPGGDG